MSSFSDDLAKLCAREMKNAINNPDRLADMTERLARSLAFTMSIGAGGDPELSQKLMTGVESYLYETASEMAGFGKLAVGRGKN